MLLTEDYYSDKELHQLAEEILLEVAKINLSAVLNGDNQLLKFKISSDLDNNTYSNNKYKKLDKFIRSNLTINFLYKENFGNNPGYFLGSNNTIYLHYNSELYSEFKDIQKRYELYTKIYFYFKLTLIHELKHVYDNFISNGKFAKDKETKFFDSLSNEDKIKNYDRYLKQHQEITARFLEALYQYNFYNTEYDDNFEPIEYKIKSLKKCLNELINRFYRFNLLTKNKQYKLINKISSYYHKEIDEIKNSADVKNKKIKMTNND